MESKRLFSGWVAVLLLTLIASGCKDDDENPDPEPEFDIMLNESSLGKVLTDKDGMTLYFFAKDADGTSKCTGNCLSNWPIFSMSGTIKLGEGLEASDFGTHNRADGNSQVTYKGWPLYYYTPDAVKGDVKGENVGKLWFVAKSDYTIMLVSHQLVGNNGKSYKSDYTEGTGETQYFVDDRGRTLYSFMNDKFNKNKYTKEDLSNEATWPIYTAEIKSVPTELDDDLFEVITVFNRKQLTYKGWPIYYFGADAQTRGSNKGVSVPQVKVWPVLQKDVTAAVPE